MKIFLIKLRLCILLMVFESYGQNRILLNTVQYNRLFANHGADGSYARTKLVDAIGTTNARCKQWDQITSLRLAIVTSKVKKLTHETTYANNRPLIRTHEPFFKFFLLSDQLQFTNGIEVQFRGVDSEPWMSCWKTSSLC